jgi:tripartite-type tricarboxylate transporter receptor subunit TctC
MRRTALRMGAAVLVGLSLRLGVTASRAADIYPTRAIQIIGPFEPSGSIDVTFRIVAPALAKQLGQSVVVVNRPGAVGTIGMNEAVKAPPDGDTLGAASFALPPIQSAQGFRADHHGGALAHAGAASVGSQPVGDTPEEFRAHIVKETATWADVARQIGIGHFARGRSVPMNEPVRMVRKA